MKKYEAWLKQARKDLLWAKDTASAGHYAQSCFVSQQVAEKALKAIAYFRGYDLIKSHSLVNIIKDLSINSQLAEYARVLDLYYLSSRYPDALPDNIVPSDFFTKDQAESAIKMAEAFLEKANHELSSQN